MGPDRLVNTSYETHHTDVQSVRWHPLEADGNSKPSGGYGIVPAGGCPKGGDPALRSKAQPPHRHPVGLDGELTQYTDWTTRLLYTYNNMSVGA